MKKIILAILLLFICTSANAATLYVRTDGSDANCNGSANVAYSAGVAPACADATINASVGAASAGDIISIGDGTYAENSGSGYLAISKTVTLTPQNDYGVTLRAASGTSRVINVSAASSITITLGKIIVDAQSTQTYGINVSNYAGGYALTLNGTKFLSPTQYAIIFASTVMNFTATDVIHESAVTTVATFYSANTQTAGTWVIDNLHVTNTGVTSSAGGGVVFIANSASGNSFTIRNSDINITSTTSTYGIRVSNTDNPLIEDNTVTINGNISGYAIFVINNNASYTTHNAVIRRNTIRNNGTGGICILHGSDGSTASDNLHNNGVIYGNTVIGSTNSTTLHGIMLGSNTGGMVWGNKVMFTNLPLLSKLNTGGVWVGNEARNITGNGMGIRCKGATNNYYAHNGVYLNEASDYGIYVDDDPTIPTHSTGIKFVDNTIYATATNAYFASVDADNTAWFGGNKYYTTGTLASTQWRYQGTGYETLALWQAALEPSATFEKPFSVPNKYTDPISGTWNRKGQWTIADLERFRR